MRPLLIALTFTLVLGLDSFLPSWGDQSQSEMTEQAWADFDKADKELNQVYQKALKAADDDIARQKLVKAQKAWLAFRDAEADVDADLARGGTLAPQLEAMSETETTKARTAQLKRFMADQ